MGVPWSHGCKDDPPQTCGIDLMALTSLVPFKGPGFLRTVGGFLLKVGGSIQGNKWGKSSRELKKSNVKAIAENGNMHLVICRPVILHHVDRHNYL
jgi:hypothetical protein